MPQDETQPTQDQQVQGAPQDNGLAPDADQHINQFLAEQNAELDAAESGGAQPRDEYGRFVSQTGKSDDGGSVDPIWLEAAKEAGIPESELSSLKTPEQIEQRIQTQRIMEAQKAIQTLGIDAQEFINWRQSMQQQGQQQGGGQQGGKPQADDALTKAVEELQLKIDEESLGDELSEPLKILAEEINKTKAVLRANTQLQQRVEALEAGLQQRAAMDQQAQMEKHWANTWDKVSAQIPGYQEYFGKPSELKRLMEVRPDDQRAIDAVAFDQYFQKSWSRFAKSFGETETALKLALADAWEKAPFSRLAGRKGSNGNTGTPQNGSVVRHGVRRTGPERIGVEVDDVDRENGELLAAELKAIAGRLGKAWDDVGGNPWRNDSP